jgi:hypothetical protein
LPGLIEARLAEQVEGLEFTIERMRAAAESEHRRAWPNDVTGAEVAATLTADEEALREVSRIYLQVLQWASDLLSDRLSRSPTSFRPRLPSLRRERPPADLEVPEPVADALTHERPQYGWPIRVADSGARRPQAA